MSSRVAKPEKVGSERGRRFAFDVDANLMLVSVVVHAGVYLEGVLLEVFADPLAFFGLGEPGVKLGSSNLSNVNDVDVVDEVNVGLPLP